GRPQPDQAPAARTVPPRACRAGARRLRGGRAPACRGAVQSRAPRRIPRAAAARRRVAPHGTGRHNARLSFAVLHDDSRMNQTRTFLIFAWLVVATLLFMAWGRDHATPPAQAGGAATEAAAPTA